MDIPIYQIDAFSSKLFSGNPAAVCPLTEWLTDAQMQAIAMENNLSETAFFVVENEHYHIRWFTPKAEVALCGHATLAAAYVIFNELGFGEGQIRFDSLSGELRVGKIDNGLRMDFPAQPAEPCDIPDGLFEALGGDPVEIHFSAEDYIVSYASEADVRNLVPDFNRLGYIACRGVVATAAGDEVDFVSRFFAPGLGINEDPVTGSAHCKLTPLWASRLAKGRLEARQISARGGDLGCELIGDRVWISGQARKFMQGMICL